MIKSFASLASLLILMVMFMWFHLFTFPYDAHTQSLHRLTKLTQFCELSLSLSYDDARFNATYPDMPALGRMDFVYER